MPLATPAPPAWIAPGGVVRVHVRTAGPASLELGVGDGRRVLARRRGSGVLAGRIGSAGRRVLTVRLAGEAPLRLVVVVRPLRLAAVGDISPGSAIAAVRAHGPRWHWHVVGPFLRRQDVVVGNLETAIGRGGEPWPGKLYHFLAPPSVLAPMRTTGGVDVVSLANNHALDYGRATFRSGLRAIRASGLASFGGGDDLAAAMRPAIVERGGLRIAFVGFDEIEPPGFWASAGTSGTAPMREDVVRRAIAAARPRADLVVAMFHWGTEYATEPTDPQRRFAAIALAAGARVVLGAHPHVLQPVESRSGHRLVAWSLGNFVFQPGRPAGARTEVLGLALTARGVVGWRGLPVRIVGTRPLWVGGG